MGDYLYIAKVDSTEDGEGEAWVGKLSDFKNNLVRKTENIDNLLRTAHRNLTNTIHMQSEFYTNLIKDTNLKNDEKIQFLALKLSSIA